MSQQPVVDRYGFMRKLDPHESEPAHIKEQRGRKERERVDKWKVMLASSKNPYRIMRSRKFQQRVRKGIPESLRSEIWSRWLLEISEEDRDWARSIIATSKDVLEQSDAGKDAIEAIRKDLSRTYPGHVRFQTAEGQVSLETVLMGYAAFDIEVGYCQGMSFVAALLLMFLNELEALCALKKLMTKSPWNMRDLFKPGMTAVGVRMHQYDVILGRAASKVSKHFRRLKFETSMYATHWFATVFTYNFPFFLVLRVWDVFLMQGWPIVIGTAVAFWRMYTKEICNVPSFEQLFETLKKLLGDFPVASADPLMIDACHVADKYATEDQLRGLEREYLKAHAPPDRAALSDKR